MANAPNFSPIFWRRPKEPATGPESIQSSAVRVDLSNRKMVDAVLKSREKWQDQVVDDIDAIGELQYGVGVPANLVSRVTFFAATMPDEKDAEPVRCTSDDPSSQLAIDTIERLGNLVTRSDIFHDLAFNLLSTGECYLVCFAEREAETDSEGRVTVPATDEHWAVRSVKEVEKSGDTIKTYDVLTQRVVTLDREGDTFLRIYNPDPFRHDKATSHLKAVLGPAEELLWWDAASVAAAKNRMTLAGMIAVPSNIEATSVQEGEDPNQSGSQRFITRLVRTLSRAVRNPTDAAAAVPNVVSYPNNDQKKSGIEILEWNRPVDELLEKRTDRSLVRLEQGINLPKGVVSGLGQATHWGGGQIEESVFRDHVEPLVILICSALTSAFLVPILAESNVDTPSQFFVWYDASNLIIHRDRAANVLRAYELGEANGGALRRELGLSERDKPTPEEKEATAEWMRSIRGAQKQAVVENPTDVTETPDDPNASPQQNAPGERTSEQKHSSPARGRGQSAVAASANGEVVDINGALAISRLQVMCDEQCRRALERAGNKLVSRANKNPAYRDVVRNVPTMQVAATLGRERVTKLGSDDLFDGAFDNFHSRYLAFCPAEITATATVRPVQELLRDLRLLCAKALFDPPGPEPMVPVEIVAKSLNGS